MTNPRLLVLNPLWARVAITPLTIWSSERLSAVGCIDRTLQAVGLPAVGERDRSVLPRLEKAPGERPWSEIDLYGGGVEVARGDGHSLLR